MALQHYNVEGSHWGVRRYQNYDGTLTELGKLHYGVGLKKYSKDSKKANDVYKTLTKEEKYHLTGNAYENKLNYDEKYELNDDNYEAAAVYSLIYEMKDVPISVFDIYKYGDDAGMVAVAVRNDERYRGKGLAKKSVQEGLEWFENNPEIMQLHWAAFADNYASQKLAQEMGFELNKKESDDKVFVYSKYKSAKRR